MAEIRKESKTYWVDKLESAEVGITNQFPLSLLKDLSGQKKLNDGNFEVVTLDKKSDLNVYDFIKQGETVKKLYILVKGIMGVGINATWKSIATYYIEETTLFPFSILGELEVPMTIETEFKKCDFGPHEATRSAWRSSKTLGWLCAYDLKERQQYAEDAVLLSIPVGEVNSLLSDSLFREYLLFDTLYKSRGYFLPIGYSKKDRITNEWSKIIADSLLSFYEQRLKTGFHINKEVYILGADVFNIITPGTTHKSDETDGGGVFKEVVRHLDTEGMSLAVRIGKENEELAKTMKERDNKFCQFADIKGKPKAEKNKYIAIDKHLFKVYLLKPKNSKS